MARASDFGVSGRPTTRAIQQGRAGNVVGTGDVRSSRPPARGSDEEFFFNLERSLNFDFLDFNRDFAQNRAVTDRVQAEATRRARQSIGFKTDAQLRAEAQKIRDSGPHDSRTNRKNAGLFLERAKFNQNYAFQAAYPTFYRRVFEEEAREAKKLDTAEGHRRNREQLENERLETQSRIADTARRKLTGEELQGSVQRFTSDQIKNLNLIEASARVAIKGNPDLSEGFNKFLTFSDQLTQLPPEERDAQLDALREEANAIVDPYFDQLESQVKGDLKNKLREINERFGLFEESQQFQLDQKIESLDRQSAESLSSSIEDLSSRNALSSGIAKNIANQIIDSRENSINFEETIADFEKREQQINKKFGELDAKTKAERDILDIGREKETEQQKQFFGLLGEEEALSFLQQFQSASDLQVFDESGELPPSIPSPSGSISRPLPPDTTRAPAGSSLDIARRQQAGEISVAEQRRLRDALLNTPAPRNAPSRKTTPSSRTSSSDLAKAVDSRRNARITRNSTTTSAGSKLLQNRNKRRSERLSRQR